MAVYSRSVRSAESVLAVADELRASTSKIDVYADELDCEGSGLSALLQRSDIGAVIVALPILVQLEVVRKCLAAGKHVLCEKPVAKDTKAALDPKCPVNHQRPSSRQYLTTHPNFFF